MQYLGFIPVSPDDSPYFYERKTDEVINRRHGSLRKPTLHPGVDEGSTMARLLDQFAPSAPTCVSRGRTACHGDDETEYGKIAAKPHHRRSDWWGWVRATPNNHCAHDEASRNYTYPEENPMRKFVALSLLLAWTSVAQPGDADGLALVKKAIAAAGGEEKLAKYQT